MLSNRLAVQCFRLQKLTLRNYVRLWSFFIDSRPPRRPSSIPFGKPCCKRISQDSRDLKRTYDHGETTFAARLGISLGEPHSQGIVNDSHAFNGRMATETAINYFLRPTLLSWNCIRLSTSQTNPWPLRQVLSAVQFWIPMENTGHGEYQAPQATMVLLRCAADRTCAHVSAKRRSTEASLP